MRFNDAFHFSRPTKREKTMRHRVVSKDNRTGSKVLLLLRETNEAMETSSSRKRFALLLLSPLFSSISGFPSSCLLSPPLKQIREFFHFFFNHIELRIDAYQIFGKTIKNIFIFFLVFKSLGNVADLNLDAFKPSRLVIRPRYLDLPSSDLYSIRL